jgi:hypothetical protein
VSSYSELSTEFLSLESLFRSQKFGRFGVRPMVALSSFRLAYNVLGLEEVRVLKALNFLYRKPELNVLNFIATL